METWKIIDGSNGRYSISENGDVRLVSNKKILNVFIQYHSVDNKMVALTLNGKRKGYRIDYLLNKYFPEKHSLSKIESFDGEEWGQLENYPDYYFSSFGRVKSNNKLGRGERLLKCAMSNGYKQITVRNGVTKKMLSLHRVIATIFCDGNISSDLQVNHIDGNKLNNHYSNLEWVTISENVLLAWRDGLCNTRGSKHGASKLKEEYINNIIAEYPSKSMNKIAIEYNVAPETIRSIIIGKSWKHVDRLRVP